MAHLFSLECDQAGWKPPTSPFKSLKSRYDLNIDWLKEYFTLVDSSDSEAGRMPILCDILMKSISIYKNIYKSSCVFRIIPIRKVLKDYKTDYLIGVMEMSQQMRMLVVFELKQSSSPYLANVKVMHLAQVLVQGYYALLGNSSLCTIVVALTDIATTHFFKLKLPSTRPIAGVPKNVDLVWHKCLMLPRYPPTQEEDLFTFIEHLHFVINEVS